MPLAENITLVNEMRDFKASLEAIEISDEYQKSLVKSEEGKLLANSILRTLTAIIGHIDTALAEGQSETIKSMQGLTIKTLLKSILRAVSKHPDHQNVTHIQISEGSKVSKEGALETMSEEDTDNHSIFDLRILMHYLVASQK